MEAKPEIARESLPELRHEFAARIEPGDLIFILIGHELVERFRHRAGEGGRPEIPAVFERRYVIRKAPVVLGIGGVLIIREHRSPARDEFGEGQGRIGFGRCGHARQQIRPGGGQPPQGKVALVRGNSDAIQLDRALNGGGRDGQQPLLTGIADHDQVGGDTVSGKADCERGRIEEIRRVRARRGCDGALECACVEIDVCILLEIAGGNHMAVDDGTRPAGPDGLQCIVRTRNDEIAPQQHICFAAADARRRHAVGVLSDPQMAHHRAILLRKPGHVENRRSLPFHMRGHAEDRADRYDPGAADTGDHHRPGPIEGRQLRFG